LGNLKEKRGDTILIFGGSWSTAGRKKGKKGVAFSRFLVEERGAKKRRLHCVSTLIRQRLILKEVREGGGR